LRPSSENFQNKLDEIFDFAQEHKLISVTVKAGKLHKLLEEVRDGNHRMPICCEVMYKNMKSNDQIISYPPKGKGTTLTIQYFLPR
jgi:hypothetical protein